MRKAVSLLSGGLDSITSTAIAINDGFEVYGLSFDYGQRHDRELESAKRIAKELGLRDHRIIRFDLRQWGGSALTDDIDVPQGRSDEEIGDGIPSTYVPARNTIFLAFALSYAEAIDAHSIYIGANDVDYSGYPDCRLHFFEAFEYLASAGTRRGVNGGKFAVKAPLLRLRKEAIIRRGLELGVDYGMTWSCYLGGEYPCGTCDSCRIRRVGFRNAGFEDPLEYPV